MQAPQDTGFLFMNADRVLYMGLLGQPDERVMGAHTVYVSCRGQLVLRCGDAPAQRGEMLTVPPYVPHRIEARDKLVYCLLIEPEYLGRLPAGWQPSAEAVRRLRAFHQHVVQPGQQASLPEQDNQALDQCWLGQALPARTLEPRIAQIMNLMRTDPAFSLTAAECAALCQVSASRFMHLFKSEVGYSFRHVRTWKRARHLLALVKRQDTLTTIAQELGYTDAAYFSNSIRQVSGLRPKDIIAGARRVKVIRST